MQEKRGRAFARKGRIFGSLCNTSVVFSPFFFLVLRQGLLHLAAACLSNVSNCCVVGTTECYSLIHRAACVEKSVGQE